jgi:hypothetical protein
LAQDLLTSRVVKYPAIFDGRDAVIDLKAEVVVCAVTELRRYSRRMSATTLDPSPDERILGPSCETGGSSSLA